MIEKIGKMLRDLPYIGNVMHFPCNFRHFVTHFSLSKIVVNLKDIFPTGKQLGIHVSSVSINASEVFIHPRSSPCVTVEGVSLYRPNPPEPNLVLGIISIM